MLRHFHLGAAVLEITDWDEKNLVRSSKKPLLSCWALPEHFPFPHKVPSITLCEGLHLSKHISIHPRRLEMVQPCPPHWRGPLGLSGGHCPRSAQLCWMRPSAPLGTTSHSQVLQVIEQNGSLCLWKGNITSLPLPGVNRRLWNHGDPGGDLISGLFMQESSVTRS